MLVAVVVVPGTCRLKVDVSGLPEGQTRAFVRLFHHDDIIIAIRSVLAIHVLGEVLQVLCAVDFVGFEQPVVLDAADGLGNRVVVGDGERAEGEAVEVLWAKDCLYS